jgi:hypothetical protein
MNKTIFHAHGEGADWYDTLRAANPHLPHPRYVDPDSRVVLATDPGDPTNAGTVTLTLYVRGAIEPWMLFADAL